jgi:hypothetical protein
MRAMSNAQSNAQFAKANALATEHGTLKIIAHCK